MRASGVAVRGDCRLSTAAAIVGWFMIVFGALCMIVGLLGAAKALLSDPAVATEGSFGWGDLIPALLKAGPWGVLMGAGLAIFLVGCALVGIKIKVPTG